jgi:hemolysin activation/secretion protein
MSAKSAEAPTPFADQMITLDPNLLAAKPGEAVILPQLLGVRLVTSPDQLTEPGFPARGVDATRITWLDRLTFASLPPKFLNKPASRASLDRIVIALRLYASLMGHSFVSVYLPPQDITGGYVQIVINEAKADAAIGIRGAHYFSEASYRAALHQKAGEPIDQSVLEQDVEWLNRNPYHQVQISAGSGASAGTTALDLDVHERFPLGWSASYDNTGTKSTGEDRVSAGVTWANALWRGDLMSYRFIADPTLEHSKTHSLTCTSYLPWRHIATLSASYSLIDSIMAPPFEQHGTSWQLGLNYEIPLRAPREGWTQNLSFSANLKYSDNNLLFASVPITNNPTRIPEVGATYGVGFRALGGQNFASVSGFASPGGLGAEDSDRAFNGSRFGAKAAFAYGTFNFSHQHPLKFGFTWTSNLNAQIATGALLGSEQLNGGGSSAVRGYAESTAFGDEGVVLSNELHAPALPVWRGHDQLDAFVFADLASLNLHVDRESTDLRSVGVGLNYFFGRHVSVRASYGWQLKYLDHSTEKTHAHLAANVSF